MNSHELALILRGFFENGINSDEDFDRLARIMIRMRGQAEEQQILVSNSGTAQPRMLSLRSMASRNQNRGEEEQEQQQEEQEQKGPLVDRVQVLLQERGPMPVTDIAEKLSCNAPGLYKLLRDNKFPAFQTKRPGGGRDITFYGPPKMSKTQLQAEVNKILMSEHQASQNGAQEHQAQA
jgi:hypothetical protein